MFYAVGSKVILASRNLQKLQQLKFQLDNEPKQEVRSAHTLCIEPIQFSPITLFTIYYCVDYSSKSDHFYSFLN